MPGVINIEKKEYQIQFAEDEILDIIKIAKFRKTNISETIATLLKGGIKLMKDRYEFE